MSKAIKKNSQQNNYVNLNVNPCKMCMPMGGVFAFKGLANTMIIMHGSQGCSTYIRRHMATHFNEPVDIASSSLTEHGTVYGGAENLKKGIHNLIELYNPEVIGVLTTCLAETIGEDTEGIVRDLLAAEDLDVEICVVPTAGYEATEYEGYLKATRKIVSQFATDTTPNGKINIIAPRVSPADLRELKRILDAFGVEYIMVPDYSESLDMPHDKKYERLCPEGTTLSDIRAMAGAVATIELGVMSDESLSAGAHLQEKFGIALHTLPIPIGLKNTDAFISAIAKISGKAIPASLERERGRMLDAMIDSHKYNAEGRACIFGEPDMVYAVTTLCRENGIAPRVIATGSANQAFESMLTPLLEDLDTAPIILGDTDFKTIEQSIADGDTNIMIGSSDGRRIEEKLNVPLVRVGFPVHDRIGAQRELFVGYTGSVRFLDSMTNIFLAHKEHSFRKDAYDQFYKEEPAAIEPVKPEQSVAETIAAKTQTHPCYNHGAHQYARMHLPVAPACNISCNYCTRKFDCPNETRPGVTSKVLTPEQALAKYIEVKSKLPHLKVLGIAGPGDALANFEQVKKSLELIRSEDPEVTFCLSTNGLMLPFYAQQLIDLGVSHVTVTINATDPEIGAKIYKHVNYMGKTYKGIEAARILINNQFAGLKYLTDRGVVCKVNIVMVKGINDAHIPSVVARAKECGAFMTNIMRMIPVEGSVFEGLEPVTEEVLGAMRKQCEVDLKQMYHCRQCRADAIGQLDNDISAQFKECGSCGSGKETPKITAVELAAPEAVAAAQPALAGAEEYIAAKGEKYAVSTKTGIYVDQHFGRTTQFHIYEFDGKTAKKIDTREVPPYSENPEETINGKSKIDTIIEVIADCKAVITLRAGAGPVSKLAAMDIEVIETYDEIKNAVCIAAKKTINRRILP